jgi:hypothetical protein
MSKADRRKQQDKEVEASQTAMRASIAEMGRLVDESEQMIKRHRDERDADEAAQTPDQD